MASVKKPILSVNFVAVIGRSILVYRTVTSLRGLVTPSPSVMNRPWPDWNRSCRQASSRSAVGIEFDKGILADHPELKTHPIVQHSPLNTRDALCGGRTEAMRLHHKAGDGETIKYVDVMSLYSYVCKYCEFQ